MLFANCDKTSALLNNVRGFVTVCGKILTNVQNFWTSVREYTHGLVWSLERKSGLNFLLMSSFRRRKMPSCIKKDTLHVDFRIRSSIALNMPAASLFCPPSGSESVSSDAIAQRTATRSWSVRAAYSGTISPSWAKRHATTRWGSSRMNRVVPSGLVNFHASGALVEGNAFCISLSG